MNYLSRSWLIPRRTFLKGAGSALLLPTLNSMFESEAQAAAVSPRFAAFFMNLGIYGLGYHRFPQKTLSVS